ncbi:hypothetical protein [Entomospira culicis]|uniref:Uncharacterized protein n=1 Tax=Entomospira culicis TaxID=2719989 RepID=A0A968GK71_9SPIO|nr:hypothetical protein [Entomospira culicis]NIZ19983.1 hypothetical protein [Entomospira culicis]NIZ70215.1 hypothetical protein [Entomospira culicis]WDI38083.1 hypothetical protein PVA46_08335 [Entomospira culicis]WDI39706.1 hypothetical protein PVA47_08335 [Entomospira culicis]
MTDLEKEVIQSITPLDFQAYLKERGWQLYGKLANKASLWQSNSKKILLPLQRDLVDYEHRVYDLLNDLQAFEKRSLQSILTDLTHAQADILRIYAFKDDVKNNLPLEAISTLINSSINLFSATARSITNPQPVYQGKAPKEINSFVEKLRMGHTEKGSFVLVLENPITPQLIESDDISNEPFDRQVSIKLCQNIASLLNNMANISIGSFDDNMMRGISSNFCDALAEITDVCGDKGAFIDLTWAPVRPIKKEWNISHKFSIVPAMSGTLREMSRILKEKTPETNVEIEGYVIKLIANTASSSQGGRIHIFDTNSHRLIAIDLDPKQYTQALDAHKNDNKLRFIGNLDKSTKPKSLINIVTMEQMNG